jgi:hypothetical protein
LNPVFYLHLIHGQFSAMAKYLDPIKMGIGILYKFMPPNFSLARMAAHVQIMANWPFSIQCHIWIKKLDVQQMNSNAFVPTDGQALFVTSQLKLVRQMQIPAKMVRRTVKKNYNARQK